MVGTTAESRVAERYLEKTGWDVYSMSNLRPETTGIEGVVVWISTGTSEGKKLPHGPRVKVTLGATASTGRGSASVTIEARPKVVTGKLPPNARKDVVRWIVLNKAALIQYWNDEIDTTRVIALLKSL